MIGNNFKVLMCPPRLLGAILVSALGVSALGATQLLAQDASPAPAPGFGEILSKMMPMFVFIFLIFYFLVMKPQQDKIKNQNKLISGLKRGDQVVTSSGMIAKVSTIEKDFILLEVANNVKIKFEPAHIVKRLESDQKAPK